LSAGPLLALDVASNDKGWSRGLHPDSTHCTFTLCHPKQKKEKSRIRAVCHFTWTQLWLVVTTMHYHYLNCKLR
jgi:hypothetical protein